MKQTMFLLINSLYGGGAEHIASKLSKIWNERYHLFVISLSELTDRDYQFYGSKISIAYAYKGISWIGKLKSAAKEIDKLANDKRPDVCVSFLQNANLCLMMTRCNCKKIVSVRNYLDGQYKGYKRIIMKFLVKHYFKRADYVVSVSELIKDDMVQNYHVSSKKSICIYNPYSIIDIQNKALEKLDTEHADFFEKHTVISNVGHIHIQKGQFHLIRILYELRKLHDTLGLVIVGEDKTKVGEQLKALVNDYELNDHVLFVGRHENPYKFVYNSHIFVFPSLYEGFPNALVEAMICNKPVISSDCKSGPREILCDEDTQYGYLVDDDQTGMLDVSVPITEVEKKYIEYVEMLLSDYELYKTMAGAALRRAKDFSIEKITMLWDDILSQ